MKGSCEYDPQADHLKCICVLLSVDLSDTMRLDFPHYHFLSVNADLSNGILLPAFPLWVTHAYLNDSDVGCRLLKDIALHGIHAWK